MSEAMDIRVWARDQGLDIATKGKIPDTIRQQWLLRDEQDDEDQGAAGGSWESAVDQPADQPKPRPQVKQPWWKRPRNDISPPSPQKTKRRVSTDQVISLGWSLGATILGQPRKVFNDANELAGYSVSPMLPVARVLQLQAPVAGVVLDDVVKGTVMDKVLQPLARTGEKAEKIAAIAGPPIIVAAITMNPSIMPIARPMLKACLMSWIEVAGPAMKKAEAKMQKMAEAIGEAGIDIDEMIDSLFAPPPGFESPSEDEEHAAQRAANWEA